MVDTDVFSLITWARGRHLDFEALIAGHLLALSFATVGELRAGAIIGKWGDKRRQALEERIRQLIVLPANDATTEMYGQLYARFRGRLKDGGINDMWVAACALAQKPEPLPLVTANLSDFQTIAGEFAIRIVHPDLQ